MNQTVITGMEQYLSPTFYIDSDNPTVISYALEHTKGATSDIEKAVKLYYAVRDNFRYDPYHVDLRPESLTASACLKKDFGYCVEKANILAAAARAVGIPSRLAFANVRNHLSTDRLIEVLKSDIFVFHGFTELFLNGRWVKATPAFNLSLCQKFGVAPLDFDGVNDSIFQEFDGNGHEFMEYIKDHGSFADLPRDLFVEQLKEHYPHLFESGNDKGGYHWQL